ncbi:MAG: S41 family peptidase [bacterium]|nr:S41 family peptidase [bacterium]
MKHAYFYFLTAGFLLLTSLRYSDTITDQQEDFRVFRTILESKEGTLDMHLSSDSISYYLDQLQVELSKDKSQLEEFKLYSEMIARLDQGHTQVLNNRKIQAEWLLEQKSLPIDLYLLDRHLIVGEVIQDDYENTIRDNDPEGGPSEIPVGSEILSIDEHTVPEMMEGIGKYLSGDEGAIGFKYYQAQELFEFYRHLAFPLDKDSVEVTYITPKSDTVTQYLQPGKAPIHSMNRRLMKASEEYLENETNIGKFKIVSGKYGYFRFTTFARSSGAEYDVFLEESFRELKDNSIDELVIDLRGNTGGVMQYDFIKYFVGEGVNIGRYVIAKPFKGLDNKYVKKVNMPFIRYAYLSWSQKRQVKNGTFDNGTVYTDWVDDDLRFKGKVAVITDEGTFSSAAILACQLKTLAKAKIVGRPAGGSFYSGNAGTLLVKLPESGLLISVNPNTFYSHLTPVDDPLEIRQPDAYVDALVLDEKERNKLYFKAAVALFRD